MKPVWTKRVRQILERMGCVKAGTEGSHEKWRTPGGISDSIVADRDQSPGVMRHVQRTFAPEFGEGWLERELGR